MNINDPKVKERLKEVSGDAAKQISYNMKKYNYVVMCKRIQKDRNNMSFEDLKDKYEEFYDKHEPLFMMAATRKMSNEDFENLKGMLLMMQKVHNKQMNYTQASQTVSYYAAKKYAPELLNKDLKKN